MKRVDWPAALAFSVAFIVVGSLVYLGKLQEAWLASLLTWLIPAPLGRKSVGS